MRMKAKRNIAYLLFVISMLMPIIPVIPHHHHADGRLCLKNDISTDCCKHQQHHDGTHDHCCGGDCVTLHFFEQTPNTDDTWSYTFAPEAVILFFEPIIHLQLTAEGAVPDKEAPPYIEHLYSTQWMRATGMRAPPCDLITDLN